MKIKNIRLTPENCIKYKIPHGSKTIEKNIIEQRALKKRMKNDNIHFFKAKELSQLCPTPQKGEQYRIITEKQFNAFALIVHIIEKYQIEELYLAIYRINEPTVDALMDYIDSGKIKKATFIISNFFGSTKKPEKWADKLRAYCNIMPQCRHAYTHNHTKILILQTNNNYFVFEGSGNMSDNARIEQYIYENNKDVYDFHKEWMEEIILRENKI